MAGTNRRLLTVEFGVLMMRPSGCPAFGVMTMVEIGLPLPSVSPVIVRLLTTGSVCTGKASPAVTALYVLLT